MLTKERVREVLDYDPDTGLFVWKLAIGRRASIGKEVGSINNRGYILINIDYKSYTAHRLAWLHFYGKWPEAQIDHINQSKSDNRISNLREVTNSENHKNLPMYRHNTSGTPGVTWHKASGKWMAKISINGNYKYLGAFNEKSDAVEVRKVAEKKYGYHENHGKQKNVENGGCDEY